MTFGRTILFVPSRFWTTHTNFDNCYQCYIATCGKTLYRCISTFLAVNYCGGIFSNFSAIYTKWGAQTFSPIFGLFAVFDHNFAKIVAPCREENEKYAVHLKGLSIPKKTENHIKIDPLTVTQYRFELCTPQTNSGSADRSVTNTHKHTNTIFSHLQLARIVRSPQTLLGDRSRRDH